MEWIATLGGDMHVMMIVLLTLILSYCSVFSSVSECLKLQRRLEQVGHVESGDTAQQ